MTARHRQNFPQRYFQRKVDDRAEEIRRLNLKILELERYERQWPTSEPIKRDLENYRAKRKKLNLEQHKYLYRIS